MLKKLDKRNDASEIVFEPSEGERTLLSSNKGGIRSPSLDLYISETSPEDALISTLSDILFEGFLWQHTHGKHFTTEGSSILPGINKRTG